MKLILTTVTLCLVFHFCLTDLVVELPSGKIRGRTEISLNKNVTFYSFQQIPYAKPPIGKLRFMPPQPVETWDGILDCIENTKMCYQMPSDNEWESEDCLHLNVYTPVKPGVNASLPVMYYIYGGGFILGDALFNTLGPHYFMENDVIIVTIFYRLGPFGFLSTNDDVILGNNGLKDQNLGLQWVQENIQLFGGDPKKVTIFGESAGSASVSYQILSKKSKGLFRAAIGQSGSAICPWAYQRYAKSIAYQLAAFVDPNFDQNSTSLELLEFLQNTEATVLDRASNMFKETIGNEQIIQGFYFAPVVEPNVEDAFITERMYESIENGNFTHVPLMMGICSEEAIGRTISIEDFKNSVQQYEADTALLVINDFHINKTDQKRLVGNLTRQIYTDGLFIDDLAEAVKYFSDTCFSRAVIRHGQLQSAITDVFFYEFSYHGKLGGNDAYVEGADRVKHAEDINYLWCPNNQSNPSAEYPESDILTLERFIRLFTNFAKTLNPTPENEELLGNVTWPTMKSSSLKYLNINETLEIKENPKEAVYQKWLDLYETYAMKPYDTF